MSTLLVIFQFATELVGDNTIVRKEVGNESFVFTKTFGPTEMVMVSYTLFFKIALNAHPYQGFLNGEVAQIGRITKI